MTNGEKMQEVFPEGKTRKCRDGVVFESDGWCHAYDSDWWNAEYKELTTKNCESCRYYGSHHEVCKYCYECSLWTQGEPTTKNNLGVEWISRDSAIKALDYDIKCFEFKSGVSKHMDDIAKLLNTIYETQVNNIKALPSVTPQEPKPMVEIDLYSVIKQKYIEREVLDKIRAEIEKLQKMCDKNDLNLLAQYSAFGMVLDIIDRYKAESEEV